MQKHLIMNIFEKKLNFFYKKGRKNVFYGTTI